MPSCFAAPPQTPATIRSLVLLRKVRIWVAVSSLMPPASPVRGRSASGSDPGLPRIPTRSGPKLPSMASMVEVDGPDDLMARLDRVGYLADRGLATAAFLAVRMGRPLFCEGEPGTGKTALALALSQALALPLIRLQCHEGIDAAQALYDWDFPRQLLHLRTLEALPDRGLDADAVEASLYSTRFLLA